MHLHPQLFDPEGKKFIDEATMVCSKRVQLVLTCAPQIEILSDNAWPFRDHEIEVLVAAVQQALSHCWSLGLQSFMNFAKDNETGNIYYEDYLANLSASS